VFTDELGRPIRRQRWNEAWNKAAKVAELPPGTTPHDLRHYFASLLISKGASVKVVQTQLRHKTATETLETYAHLWPDDASLTRLAVDAELSPMLGISPTDISLTSTSDQN
jgi:integrase